MAIRAELRKLKLGKELDAATQGRYAELSDLLSLFVKLEDTQE